MRRVRRIRFLRRMLASKDCSPSRTKSSAVVTTPGQPVPGVFSHFWHVVESKKQALTSSLSSKNDCPENCFQGSTEFYDGPQTDQFTPSYLEAKPLKHSVGTRRDGTIPPWIVCGSTKSPSEQYVEWFNGIWRTGDPSTWNETVFTNLAVMIDPSGISKGAKQAAANFLLLFKYFPELRGEVVSWAANDREIFINWRFEILHKGTKTPLLVPVVDKFCFVDGRVSFRLAFFDIITLIGYLSENFGLDQLVDFLWENFWQAQRTGGMQLLPRMIWNLFKGLFVWQSHAAPAGLFAIPGDDMVTLGWEPVENAISYKISRATSIAGPYETLRGTVADPSNSYEDRSVVNGTPYWYLVSPNFEKWRPTPVDKSSATGLSRSRRPRRERVAASA